MKNKSLIIISATLILASLTGCGESKPSSMIEAMVKDMRKGFKIEGEVNLEAEFEDTNLGKVEYTYKTGYIFQNNEKTAIQRSQSTVEEDGTEYNDFNEIIFEAEDGTAYFLELDYTNKLKEYTAVDSFGDPVNYGGYYLGNPFNYILDTDFKKVDSDTYSLNREKAGFIVDRLWSHLDDVFYTIIQEANFNFENEKLTSISFKTSTVKDKLRIDYEELPCEITGYVDLTVSNIGNAKVNVPQVRPHKSEHDKLGKAFKKFKNNNYTLISDYTETIYNAINGQTSVGRLQERYYSDGSKMLYRPAYWEDDPSYYESDVILTYDKDGTFTTYGWQDDIQSFTRQGAIDNGLTSFDSKELWTLIPEIDDVAPEIFDYDSENEVYVCCDELVSFIGSECFIPLLDIDPEFNGYGTSCEIKLGTDGNIDTITVIATVNNSFNVAQIEYSLKFSNIGNTTIPADAVLVLE